MKTLTAKAKAQELIDRFKRNQILVIRNSRGNMVYPYVSAAIGSKVMEHQAKQYALICVQEIILSNPQSNPFNTSGWPTMEYWNEVKQEIENYDFNR